MMQSNARYSLYPQKIILAVFIFTLVVLVGRVIYSSFESVSVSFENTEPAVDVASVSPDLFHENAIETGRQIGQGLVLYRSAAGHDDVLWFYTHVTGDEYIARIIVDNADKNNIPLSLAFALAWEESHYQQKAVNKNASSIDRGLYQLNNKAFPKLTEEEFFNPETNARYGLAHLCYCLDLSGNEVTALAMYNAGTTKVRNDKTPQKTLNYVSDILSYKEGLEKLFARQVGSRYTIMDSGQVVPLGKKTPTEE